MTGKFTVYVGQELRKRMRKHTGINWSALAQEVFEKVIERSEEMQKVASELARLRESKAKAEVAVKDFASQHAKAWAIDHAEWDELVRVTDILTNPDEWWDCEEPNYGWASAIVEAIHGADNYGRQEVEDFVENWFRGEWPSRDEVRAFIEVADEIRVKVES